MFPRQWVTAKLCKEQKDDVTNVREVDNNFPAQNKSLKDTGDVRNARDLHE